MGGSERAVRCMPATRRSRLPAAGPWARPREKGEESHRLAATWLSCPTPSFISGKRAVRQRCPRLTLAPMFPVVDQEHHFQDKYLFYRFLDDEHEDAPLPTEEEKKECDEELQDTMLLLSQMGPDAHMRMVLRKPWVRALSWSLGPPCARLAPARRETWLTSKVLAWLHPGPKERLQRGNAAVFASCYVLLCLSQIVPFPLLHELKLWRLLAVGSGCQNGVHVLNNLWSMTNRNCSASVPAWGSPLLSNAAGQRMSGLWTSCLFSYATFIHSAPSFAPCRAFSP